MSGYLNEKYRYVRLYTALKEQIAGGTYPFGGLLPSEREIGLQYDMDRTTVRKALDMLVEDGLVEKKAGVGTKVLFCDDMSREEKTDTVGTIAFLLPKGSGMQDRITQPFYASLFYNIERECQRNGHQVIYSTLDATDHLEMLLNKRSFLGIIFVSNILPAHIALARARGIPCVLINGYHPAVPCILQDNFTGAYLACQHLIELGHRRIALVKGIASYVSSIERMRGCMAALYDSGLDVPPEYRASCDWDAASSFRAVSAMFTGDFLRPTAIAAFNDNSAYGAIRAANQAGLRVPEDLSVTGFDNIEQPNMLPQLTTVDTGIRQMAQVALENLYHQIRGGPCRSIKIVTPVHLVVRSSTEKAPQE